MIIVMMALSAILGMSIRYFLTTKVIIQHRLINITFIINIAACFILGLLYPIIIKDYNYGLITMSFLGTFSTFSSFNYDFVSKFNKSKYDGIFFLINQIILSLLVIILGYYLMNIFIGV
ncbi:MAG: CrcB family protein [Coprobacillus sp.]